MSNDLANTLSANSATRTADSSAASSRLSEMREEARRAEVPFSKTVKNSSMDGEASGDSRILVPPDGEEPSRVSVWGLHYTPVTLALSILKCFELLKRSKPAVVVAANLHYARDCDQNESLRTFSNDTDMLLCSESLVRWRSRLSSPAIPEAISGTQLIDNVLQLSAAAKARVHLVTANAAIATALAERVQSIAPKCRIVGLTVLDAAGSSNGQEDVGGSQGNSSDDSRRLRIAGELPTIRQTNPQILMLVGEAGELVDAFRDHLQSLGVPLTVAISTTLNERTVQGQDAIEEGSGVREVASSKSQFIASLKRVAPRYSENLGYVVVSLFRDAIGVFGEKHVPAPKKMLR